MDWNTTSTLLGYVGLFLLWVYTMDTLHQLAEFLKAAKKRLEENNN